MKNHKILSCKIVFFFLGLVFSQVSFAGFAVIVNPSSTISTAEKNDIRALYLHKSKTIEGVTFIPVDNVNSDIRTLFLKKIVNKNARKFKSYWTRLVFSGKAPPLKSHANDESVKRWVNTHTNAIGFIDSKNLDSSVKVIHQMD